VKLLAAAFTVVLLAVAGCGGEEGGGGDGGEQAQATAKLPQPIADDLARRSDLVAERLEANDPCGALAEAEALQEQTIQVVNARRVPPRYQEELTSAVNSLRASIECPVQVEPPPPTEAETHYDEDEEDDDD
jgi:hypothetical protein